MIKQNNIPLSERIFWIDSGNILSQRFRKKSHMNRKKLLAKDVEEAVRQLKKLSEKHKGIVCCPENCFCWEFDEEVDKIFGFEDKDEKTK